MARVTKPGDGATNLSETKDIIKNAVPRIIQLKAERKEINAAIQEQRERVNAAGVNKAALDHAIRIKEMEPEQRQAWDEGFAIARDALAITQSISLFDDLDGEGIVDDPAPAPAPDAV